MSTNIFNIRFVVLGLLVLAFGCSTGESKKSNRSESTVSTEPIKISRPTNVSGQFVSLAPEETGLDFVATIEPDHELSRLYHGVFASGGIAIGDIDGDEVPDVFCVGGAQPNRLFKQTAPFRFEDITESSGLAAGANVWGVGATLVDIDNDSDLDLYVCNYGSPNEFWVNDGHGKFVENAKAYGIDIIDASVMAHFGDYDNDGFIDFYLVTNRLYHEGGFVSQFEVLDTRIGDQLDKDLIDYFDLTKDADGKPSIKPKGRPDRLFHNESGRAFTDVTTRSGIDGDGQGISAAFWDFDDDDDLDIYVSNDGVDPDCLYENRGNGRFKDVIGDVLDHTSWNSRGATVADVNNDGLTDLLTLDRTTSEDYLSKSFESDVARYDQFVEAAEPRPYSRNFLHLNVGRCLENRNKDPKQFFLETAHVSGIGGTGWAWAPVFGDFDSDGFCDLIVTNGHTRDFGNIDVIEQLGSNINDRTQWDIFKDESPLSQTNVAFRNLDGIHFESANNWGLNHDGLSYCAATGDLDRDGDVDLVVMNLNGPVSVYRNDISSSNSLSIRLVGTRSNRSGVGATIRIETDEGIQQKELMPSRGFLASHEPILHFGLGQLFRANRVVVSWPSGLEQTIPNVNANQLLTVVEPESTVRNATAATPKGETQTDRLETARPLFHQLENTSIPSQSEKPFANSLLQPLLPGRLSQMGPGVALADINGDDGDEVYISSPAGQAKRVGLRSSEGSEKRSSETGNKIDSIFFKTIELPTGIGKEELAPLFFDADGDKDLDVYIVSGGVEFGRRAGLLVDTFIVKTPQGFKFAKQGSVPKTVFSGAAAAVADYDRDGDLDLFVGGRLIRGVYPTAPPSFLLRNETVETDNPIFVDGGATDAPDLATAGMVTSALWTDVNGDGWIDLLATTEWGNIRVYMNHEGKLSETTEQSGLANYSGFWNGIAGRDIDNDGDIDYVATNLGYNTNYSASAKNPMRIHYGLFGDSKRPQIIESRVTENGEFPLRGKDRLQNVMPFINEKFPLYRDFESSQLSDIFSATELETAKTLEITELGTSLLINDGNGHFELRPLPWIAQVAPSYGVVVTDVNCDGWSDIFVTQDSGSERLGPGGFSGGLSALMLGSETGDFEAVMPQQSGIAINSNARGLAVTDFHSDLRPDFVVGVNNHRTRFYENRSEGNIPIKIRLIGDDKNSYAIGAKVQIILQDESTQTAEVYAGGGYLSQSTRDLFFGIGSSDKIKAIQVRWPDGSDSVHPPGEAHRLTVITK